MQRFYFPNISFTDNIFSTKDKDIIYQLTKVLRIRIGEEVIFFDGKNYIDYLCIIKQIEKKEIIFSFKEKIKKIDDNKSKLHLFQAMPNKLSKIEYILQKGVEVGMDSFTLFQSNRSQKINLSDNKILRLNKIIIEATEQSNQNIIPELEIRQSILIEDYNLKTSENLFFHTSKENSLELKNINILDKKNINIFVGPEGGWDEKEVSSFKNFGYKRVFLGSNILRTETVGVAVGFFLKQS